MMASEISNAIRALRRDGYSVTMGKGGHWQVRSRAGRLLAVLSATTASRRTVANLRSNLRQAERRERSEETSCTSSAG
jgi:predicted RNA binding protein YcfA (HicA-like mRNA interferase family)